MTQPRQQQKKPSFYLQSPHSSPKWPVVSESVQHSILEVLCRLLSENAPKNHQEQSAKRARTNSYFSSPNVKLLSAVLPFLTVGLNATVASLERAASENAAVCYAERGYARLPAGLWANKGRRHPVPKVTAVFVCRSDAQSSLLHAHLPLLCYVASTPTCSVKLISLPKGSEGKLAKALGVPSVGVLGMTYEGCNMKDLKQIMSGQVPSVEIPWLQAQGGHQVTSVKVLNGALATEESF